MQWEIYGCVPSEGRANFEAQLCIFEGRWLALTVKIVSKFKRRKVLHSPDDTNTTVCRSARLEIIPKKKKKHGEQKKNRLVSLADFIT